MKLQRTESVRAALNKSPAREQRQARVFTHEAQHPLEYSIVRSLEIVQSCLLVIISKQSAVLLMNHVNIMD
jgi:hypothetical protein